MDHPYQLLVIFLVFLCATVAIRLLLHALRLRNYSLRDREHQRVLAIGSKAETDEALALLWQTHFGLGWKESIDPADVDAQAEKLLRTARKQWVDEIVFCAKDISWHRIIAWMEQLRRTDAEFKIMQPDRSFIIGPSSIESLHDLHILERHAVNSAEGRRTKRITDVCVAILLLLTLPVVLLLVRRPANFLSNWWGVFTGKMSWVGYCSIDEAPLKLPAIKRGVLDPLRPLGLQPLPIVVDRVNIAYAKDYSIWSDLRLVLRGLSRLGG